MNTTNLPYSQEEKDEVIKFVREERDKFILSIKNRGLSPAHAGIIAAESIAALSAEFSKEVEILLTIVVLQCEKDIIQWNREHKVPEKPFMVN